ncbi:MAG: MotA/TolQ/ExbB proton channel family protein [Acidobacteria bacterium]|nr:MotA/TolQ/ExbB proton channel family protein [Acidobacteriota bacterium]
MTQTIDHAMARSISRTHQEFQDRLLSLATLSSLAPLAGFLCTVLAICDSFGPAGGERSEGLAYLARRIAFACVPAALGILLGLIVLCAYRYFQGRLARADREMAVTADAWKDWFRIVDAGNRAGPDHQLQLQLLDDGDFWHDSGALVLKLLAVTWLVQAGCLFWFEYMPIALAPGAALRSLIFPFVCSLLVAYPVWVDLLRRKRSTAVVIAAVSTLGWVICSLYQFM